MDKLTLIVLIVLLAADIVLLIACMTMKHRLHHAAQMMDMETEAARQRAVDDADASQVYFEVASICQRIKENIL